MPRLGSAPLLLAISIVATGAWAATPEPSGSVVAVIQQADAVGSPTGKRALDVAAPVYIGDRIRTGAVGEAQLRFRDRTKLVVGPNSQLVIDAFVFKNNGKAQDVSINAVRGTFRFITGSSPKNAYSLKTPVATIGVRGTQFDFSVDRNGRTTLVLYEGSASLCDRAGRCVTMNGGCGIAVVAPGTPARRVTRLSERQAVLDSRFPYLKKQTGLQRGFRTDVSNCEVQKAFVPDGSGGSNGFVAPTRSSPFVAPMTPAPSPAPIQHSENTTPPAPAPQDNAPAPPPPQNEPPAPPHQDRHDDGPRHRGWNGGHDCGGNCGIGQGGGGGNGTGNEGHHRFGPPPAGFSGPHFSGPSEGGSHIIHHSN